LSPWTVGGGSEAIADTTIFDDDGRGGEAIVEFGAGCGRYFLRMLPTYFSKSKKQYQEVVY